MVQILNDFTFIVVSIIGFGIIFVLGEILPDKPQHHKKIANRAKTTSDSPKETGTPA
jgi:hypothetical protein